MAEFSFREYEAAQVSLRTLVGMGAQQARPVWMMQASPVPSRHSFERYAWSAGIDGMTEWVSGSPRRRGETRRFNWDVTNKHWSAVLQFDADLVADDMLMSIVQDAMNIGAEPTRHKNELVSDLRKQGVNYLCYDGNEFYDTAHSEGESGTQSNLLTGSGVDTLAKLEKDLAKALQKFAEYKDDHGHPYNHPIDYAPGMPSQICVVCPPAMYKDLSKIRNLLSIDPNAADSVFRGTFAILQDQYLTDANDWYVDYVGQWPLPFLMQERQAPRFIDKTNPQTSDEVWSTNTINISVDARYQAAYANWRRSVKITNT